LSLGTCRRTDLTKIEIAQNARGITKINIVESVEELRAELKSDILPNGDVLENSEVPALKSRAEQGIVTEIAKSVARRYCKSSRG
jgi:hypothetical protein